MLLAASTVALLVWLLVLALPSQPHRIRERFEPAPHGWPDLGGVAVLIPARDEAGQIGATLAALAGQGHGLLVRVVDDESADSTAAICRAFQPPPAGPGAPHPAMTVELVCGRPLAPGWSGKLWALEQGLAGIDRPWTLLLDADIELGRGVVAGLLDIAERRGAALVSIMARLRCESVWERLLAPPFVYFFKLLYPFDRVNDPASGVAAAAGGCMLVRTDALNAIGAFAAFRDALIDDCALARRVKRQGGRLWIGMSRAVASRRAYTSFGSFWQVVTRTAFTQLRCSSLLLAGTIGALAVLFIAPPAAVIVAPSAPQLAVGAAAWIAMSVSYAPIVRFYRLPVSWTLTLPVAAICFGAMTVGSAVNYWRGTRAKWRNRSYER